MIGLRSLVQNRQLRMMARSLVESNLVVEQFRPITENATEVDADDDIVTGATIANPVVIDERSFFGIVSITYR